MSLNNLVDIICLTAALVICYIFGYVSRIFHEKNIKLLELKKQILELCILFCIGGLMILFLFYGIIGSSTFYLFLLFLFIYIIFFFIIDSIVLFTKQKEVKDMGIKKLSIYCQEHNKKANIKNGKLNGLTKEE